MSRVNALEDLISWFDENRKMYFVSEYAAANLLGISAVTVRELIKKKKINFICLNGKIHIPFAMDQVLKNGKVIDIEALEEESHKQFSSVQFHFFFSFD